MHSLAQRVLSHVRRDELLKAGDRVGVAVSGGIDSVALLRLLLEFRGELGIVLSVVHFNHKLRGAESDADEEFVADLAHEHGLEFHCDSDDVARQANEEHVSVETAARELRYGFFRYLLGQNGEPQGLKTPSEESPLRGPEGPLFHGGSEVRDGSLRDGSHVGSSGTTENCALSKQKQGFNKIVTGHTLDDQAETVLMRLIRGAGMRGLGAIYPRIAVEDDDGEVCGEIVRPLLGIRRCELERYLNDIGQAWREDSTNTDTGFTRNRVRKLVVPLLEKEFNPALAGNLAELADIARGEEDYWENEAAGWMGTVVHWQEPEWATKALSGPMLVQIEALPTGAGQGLKPISENASQRGPEGPLFQVTDDGGTDTREKIGNASWLVMNASVSRRWFLAEPVAVQRRLVKAIGEQAGIPLEFKHVEAILRFAEEHSGSGKELALPLGWKLRRDSDEIVFLTPDLRERAESADYEYELALPGQTIVYEADSVFELRRVSAAAGYNPDHLLDAASLPGPLRVRNWRAGDRFWPAHTKSPKKIKELLQERHVAHPERRLWPVIVSGEEVVWMRGFRPPAQLRARPGRDAISIEEKPLRDAGET